MPTPKPKTQTRNNPDPVEPMLVYREVSDWKGKCSRLLEALRKIANTDLEVKHSSRVMKLTAEQAVKEFERNK